MAVKWVEVAGDIINTDHVAWVERQGDTVRVHLALPQPELVSGVPVQVGSLPPAGTGHVVRIFTLKVWEEAVKEAARKNPS
jgi:hypothetical protein